MDAWPAWLLFAFFFAGAMLRGQATYWIARLVTEQGLKRAPRRAGRMARLRAWLEAAPLGRGGQLIDRWGALAIAGCYLTVGLQSLVIAAAGVMRMHWLAFTAAQLLGALAWATIYTTIGFAAWTAIVVAGLESPVGIAVGVLAAMAIGVAILRGRRSRRARAGAASEGPGRGGSRRERPAPPAADPDTSPAEADEPERR